MNDEEIRSTIEQVKAQVKAKPENKDKTEDEIDEMVIDSFFEAYTKGDMSKEDLGGLIGLMGYEFTEEFENDPEAKDMVSAEEAIKPEAGAEGADESALEATRTIGEGESKEEFADKIGAVKEGEELSKPEEEGEDEEDERKKASELWKMDLSK